MYTLRYVHCAHCHGLLDTLGRSIVILQDGENEPKYVHPLSCAAKYIMEHGAETTVTIDAQGEHNVRQMACSVRV